MGVDPGYPVPIDTKHFTMGSSCPSSGHQMLCASFQTCSTGLLDPKAPSTYSQTPMIIGSKKVVAADVARAASTIVAWS
jgi:hypothetical protein